MQDIGARRLVGPKDFTGVFVHADEAGGFRSWQVDVGFVEAVAGVDEQQVAIAGDAARAHVVLADAEFIHHVEDPDHIRVLFVVHR